MSITERRTKNKDPHPPRTPLWCRRPACIRAINNARFAAETAAPQYYSAPGTVVPTSRARSPVLALPARIAIRSNWHAPIGPRPSPIRFRILDLASSHLGSRWAGGISKLAKSSIRIWDLDGLGIRQYPTPLIRFDYDECTHAIRNLPHRGSDHLVDPAPLRGLETVVGAAARLARRPPRPAGGAGHRFPELSAGPDFLRDWLARPWPGLRVRGRGLDGHPLPAACLSGHCGHHHPGRMGPTALGGHAPGSRLALALAAAATGFISARLGPRIVRIEIPIANLPAEADGLTIAHLSDVHLGTILGPSFLDRLIEQPTISSPMWWPSPATWWTATPAWWRRWSPGCARSPRRGASSRCSATTSTTRAATGRAALMRDAGFRGSRQRGRTSWCRGCIIAGIPDARRLGSDRDDRGRSRTALDAWIRRRRDRPPPTRPRNEQAGRRSRCRSDAQRPHPRRPALALPLPRPQGLPATTPGCTRWGP